VIKTLSPQQESRIPEIRERWLRIGLSCEPLDLERAQDAVKRAYAVACAGEHRGGVRGDRPH